MKTASDLFDGSNAHLLDESIVHPFGYVPETSFIVDGNLVYNLHQTGWKNGQPEMSNDIAVTIQARHLSTEIQTEIADAICTALNRKFINRI